MQLRRKQSLVATYINDGKRGMSLDTRGYVDHNRSAKVPTTNIDQGDHLIKTMSCDSTIALGPWAAFRDGLRIDMGAEEKEKV